MCINLALKDDSRNLEYYKAWKSWKQEKPYARHYFAFFFLLAFSFLPNVILQHHDNQHCRLMYEPIGEQ